MYLKKLYGSKSVNLKTYNILLGKMDYLKLCSVKKKVRDVTVVE